MTVLSLPVECLYRREDARAVNEGTVTAIAESAREIGIINPLRVRPLPGDVWEISAGAHRLEAARRLGLVEVPCIVVEDDDLHAELAMIDENLCRAELSPSDRAQQTARRKEIYEQLHPEARNGTNQHTRVGQVVQPNFADATAAATGKDARTVRRDAERGEKVIDEVLNLIRGTPLDTGAYLDKLKGLPPNEQVVVAKRDLALARDRRIQRDRNDGPDRKAAKVEADVKDRAAREVATILAEYVPADAWDGLKANLYAAGAKSIADALVNLTGQSIMDRRHG